MNGRFSEILTLTLLHSLWQGALLAALARVLCSFQRQASSRYLTYFCILIAAFGFSLATFAILADVASSRSADATLASFSVLSQLGPWIVWAWCSGVSVGLARFAFAWHSLRTHLVAKSRPATAEIAARVTVIARRIGLQRTPETRCSNELDSPATLGWFKPLILLPIQLLSRLSKEQLDALIAHELAHIRRHDYGFNLLQTAIETIYFFNPAIWWLTGEIRRERENCCDDLAISTTKDPLVYAQALALLVDTAHEPKLVASARGGSVVVRLKRISRGDRLSPPSAGWLSMLALCVLSICTPIALIAHSEYQAPQAVQQKAASSLAPVQTLTNRQSAAVPVPTPPAVQQQYLSNSQNFSSQQSSASGFASGSSSAQSGASQSFQSSSGQ